MLKSSRKTYAQLKMLSLSGLASYAINDDRFTKEKGMCQKFLRQVVQAKHGGRYDRYFYKGTAHGTAMAFKDSQYVVTGTPRPNDLVYWFGTPSQREGHAGIVGIHNRLYENSTVHWGEVTGGKGIRSLNDMRKPDLIVRLR